MLIENINTGNTHVIKLEYGADILKELEKELADAEILNGIIVNCIGSVTSYHIHVVETDNLPPGNIYFKKEAPFDVVNMQGFIFNGEVHAHVSFADAEDGSQFGGHLEEGCNVLTFCIITVMETEEIGKLDTYTHS